MWNGLVPHLHEVDKNSGGIFGGKEPQSHTRPPIQGSSARKIRPQNFWLHKPAGIESVEETSGAPSSSS